MSLAYLSSLTLGACTIRRTTQAGKAKREDEEDGPAIDTGEGRDALVCFGESRKHLEGWSRDAKTGYLAIDVMNPPTGTMWGNFNDRNVYQEQVDKLIEKYKFNVDNCTVTTAMRVAVKSAWVTNLDDALGTVLGKTIDEVPMLEFTPEGLAEMADDDMNNNLWMLSGNHRRLALEKHLSVVEKQLLSSRNALSSVVQRIKDEGLKMELEETKTRLVEEIEQREQTIAMTSRWAVEVYNRGAWSNATRPLT